MIWILKVYFFSRTNKPAISIFFIDETSKLVQNMIPGGQKGTKIKEKITIFNK